MPISCFSVNRASDEKPVPIIRLSDDSTVPDTNVMTLEQVVASPENGPFWERGAELLL